MIRTLPAALLLWTRRRAVAPPRVNTLPSNSWTVTLSGQAGELDQG